MIIVSYFCLYFLLPTTKKEKLGFCIFSGGVGQWISDCEWTEKNCCLFTIDFSNTKFMNYIAINQQAMIDICLINNSDQDIEMV